MSCTSHQAYQATDSGNTTASSNAEISLHMFVVPSCIQHALLVPIAVALDLRFYHTRQVS